VEENIHLIALNYRWPPGSWDHLSIARISRLIEAINKRNTAAQEQFNIDADDLV